PARLTAAVLVEECNTVAFVDGDTAHSPQNQSSGNRFRTGDNHGQRVSLGDHLQVVFFRGLPLGDLPTKRASHRVGNIRVTGGETPRGQTRRAAVDHFPGTNATHYVVGEHHPLLRGSVRDSFENADLHFGSLPIRGRLRLLLRLPECRATRRSARPWVSPRGTPLRALALSSLHGRETGPRQTEPADAPRPQQHAPCHT